MSNCDHTFHRLGGIDDCPVCNPSVNYTPSGMKTEIAGEFVPDRVEKPRQFWIWFAIKKMAVRSLVYESPQKPQSYWLYEEQPVRTIEYAAYEAELARSKGYQDDLTNAQTLLIEKQDQIRNLQIANQKLIATLKLSREGHAQVVRNSSDILAKKNSTYFMSMCDEVIDKKDLGSDDADK